MNCREIEKKLANEMRGKLFGLLVCCLLFSFQGDSLQGETRLNVLMFVVDDLRPMLGAYGNSQIHTPHIDRLSEAGRVYTKAYCQVPQCGPSRVSVLTGLRPDTSGIHTLLKRFRKQNFPGISTLPEYFKSKGYTTLGYGKVFHDGRDVPESWSKPLWAGRPTEMFEYVNTVVTDNLPFNERSQVATIVDKPRLESDFFQAPDVPDNSLFAGRMTGKVLADLNSIESDPFFITVGFRRPHLPFVAPKRFFDLYPIYSIALPTNQLPPVDAPVVAYFNSNKFYDKNWRKILGLTDEKTPTDIDVALDWASSELRSYRGIPYPGTISQKLMLQITQAYMACVSYVDAQIGRIVKALETSQLMENTIVVLWSDHGYHLGEQGIIGKLTNYEVSARVPLLIVDPRNRIPERQTEAPVELLDLYPTLCELAELDIPDHVEGRSLLSTTSDQILVARTQYLRDGLMGRSVRSEQYRYVEWRKEEGGGLIHREFYDYSLDAFETRNLVGELRYEEIIQTLQERL